VADEIICSGLLKEAGKASICPPEAQTLEFLKNWDSFSF
jgi:hypothetical protein